MSVSLAQWFFSQRPSACWDLLPVNTGWDPLLQPVPSGVDLGGGSKGPAPAVVTQEAEGGTGKLGHGHTVITTAAPEKGTQAAQSCLCGGEAALSS